MDATSEAHVEPATETEYWAVNLEPDDCEYCGTNYNRLDVALEPDGEYRFSSAIGCYGGDEYRSRDKTVFIAWLREQDDWFRRCFPDEPDALSELIDAVDSNQPLPHVAD